MRAKIFADGVSLEEMKELMRNPVIKGFTFNPSLLRKLGVTDYEKFGKSAVKTAKDYPVSFEVLSDDPEEIKEQAIKISEWGENVYVKVPITTTRGGALLKEIADLSFLGVKVNVTAIFTRKQAKEAMEAMNSSKGIVSVFAGRIADAGVDPLPTMQDLAEHMRRYYENQQLLWASPRQVFDVVLADKSGCHIITASKTIIDKLPLLGKNLNDFSLDTVKMFYDDAQKAGYTI